MTAMRNLFAFLLLAVVSGLAADKDFNGRWDITVGNEPRMRAWWLEVNSAGAADINGRFVGAPGGNMDTIPEITVQNGELRFVFERGYGRNEAKRKGIYTAKLVKGQLEGDFYVEGSDSHTRWIGKRAPVIKDKDDGSWREGKRVEMFNGKDLSGWLPLVPGRDIGWTVKDGALANVAGANNLVSEQKFWNFLLHVEYRVGAKSNSGIGLRGRYEVQIIEDYGRPPNTHTNGALYSRIPPSENASKPAGEWQTYDIRLVGRDVTIVLNGKKVVQGEIEGLTAIAHDPNEAEPGPISLQGDHGPVEFRKVTLTPLVKK